MPAPAAHILSNYYNKTRTNYYRALDKSCQDANGAALFVEYAITGLLEDLTLMLADLWMDVWELAWRDYVHETLPDGSKVRERQRHLLFAIEDSEDPVTRSTDLRFLNSKTAEDYRKRGVRTATRDLQQLLDLELLIELDDDPDLGISGGYFPHKVAMHKFRPISREAAVAAVADMVARRLSKGKSDR